MPFPTDPIRLLRDFEALFGPPERLYPEVELFDQAKADASLAEAVELVEAQDRRRQEWLEGAAVNAERARRGLEPLGGVKVARKRGKWV